MPLAIDASTPALGAAANAPWTSASFTPPNNSLLVLVVMADGFGTNPTLTPTSTGLTFTSRVRQGGLGQGVVEVFTAEVGANGGSARTVSCTTNNTNDSGGVKVYVVTGYDTVTIVDTTGTGASTTNNITPTVLTTGVDNAWVIGGGVEETGALGVPSSTDVFEAYDDADISFECVRKSAATSPAGAVTLNFDAAGTGTADWYWAAISIRPAASGSTDLNPVWFPGFMAGTGFPSFMLSAFNPAFPGALPYDVGQTAGVAQAAADVALGTGSAFDPTRTVAPGSQAATATGTANNPTGTVSPGPSVATGTGAAQAPSPSVQPVSGVASGTGTAFNATVSTGSFTNASAGLASATGVAYDPTRIISPAAGVATGSGSANGATGSVAPSSTTATGTGVAYNPTIQTGSFTNASAGVATGTGAAQTPNPKVSPTTNVATASGTANNASPGLFVNAGVATATGAAFAASVTRTGNAQAGVATATGTVTAAKIAVLAAAEAAVGLAVALTPTAGAFLPGTAHHATGQAPTASATTATTASASSGAMTVPTATGG